jgi:hypothetical protein
MPDRPTLIVQAARGSAVERQLAPLAPWDVSTGEVVLNVLPADAHGHLEPPAAGQVVLSVPSPEGLSREAAEVQRVIARAGTGVEPLVIVVEAADELREDELAAAVEAAGDTSRPVILRVMRDG